METLCSQPGRSAGTETLLAPSAVAEPLPACSTTGFHPATKFMSSFKPAIPETYKLIRNLLKVTLWLLLGSLINRILLIISY